MSEKPTHKVDELFQQGAEQYDFAYKQEAWEKMALLLRRDERRRGFLWWFFGLCILLLIGVACFVGKKYGLFSATPPSLEMQLFPADSLQEQAPFSPDCDAVLPDSGTSLKSEDALPVYTAALPATRRVGRQLAEGQHDVRHLSVQVNEPDPASAISSRRPLIAFSEQLASVLEVENPNIAVQSLPKIRLPHHLYWHVNGGAEVSSAKLEGLSRPTLKAGMELEYSLSQRLSSSLGLNYIRKEYQAGEGAYIPPKGFWTRRIAPVRTDGVCQIMEVPLSLRFYPQGIQGKSGLYFKAGLTSYFMLRERYQYEYLEPDPDLIQRWGSRFKNHTWLGVGEISVGYQKALSPGYMLQLAPYAQIPLSGTGHGKVKLWNAGIALSLRFQAK